MPKLRLIQERRKNDSEPSPSTRTDIRNFGDPELFHNSGIRAHLDLTNATDSHALADICAAYKLKMEPHEREQHGFSLLVRGSGVGDHKKDSLILLVAAMEIRRKMPTAKCSVYQSSGLRRLLHERMDLSARHEEQHHTQSHEQAHLSIHHSVAMAAHHAGLLPEFSDKEWHELSDSQIESIHEQLSSSSAAEARMYRKAA